MLRADDSRAVQFLLLRNLRKGHSVDSDKGGWVCEACADLDFSGFVNADKDVPEKGPGVMSDMELVLGNRRGKCQVVVR